MDGHFVNAIEGIVCIVLGEPAWHSIKTDIGFDQYNMVEKQQCLSIPDQAILYLGCAACCGGYVWAVHACCREHKQGNRRKAVNAFIRHGLPDVQHNIR